VWVAGLVLARMRKCQAIDVRFEKEGVRGKKDELAIGRTTKAHTYLRVS
jgi:hypothetical protein